MRFFRYSKSGKIFLENDQTLLDYNIQNESLIYLEIDYYLSKMKIQIFYNKNILEINECTTCFSSTVLEIKK